MWSADVVSLWDKLLHHLDEVGVGGTQKAREMGRKAQHRSRAEEEQEEK